MLKIVYYYDSKLKEKNVLDLINSIKKESVSAKIKANILFVAERNGRAGNFVTKTMRGFNFSEIRIKVSKDLYRVLYCVWRGELLVILHMFIKKEGERTPEKELTKAQEKYKDFINNR